MKHIVKIPKVLKVGGHDYTIEVESRELMADMHYGTHSEFLRRIRLFRGLLPQQLSNTFLHEVIHAVNEIYCDSSLEERNISSLANGLHQIMEQLEIRFQK